MKKKIVFAVTAVVCAVVCAFSLVACDPGDGSDKNGGDSTALQAEYAAALKDAGESIAASMTAAPAESAPVKNNAPAVHREEIRPSDAAVYGAWVSTLAYYMGLLYDDNAFTATEVPATIAGEYDNYVDGEKVGDVMSVAWKFFAIFDKQGNSIKILVEQTLSGRATDMAFDLNYDFGKKKLGAYSLSFGAEGGMLIYDGASFFLPVQSDDDYAALTAKFDALFADFAAKKPQSAQAPDGSAAKYAVAYKHCMALLGQSVDIRVHEEA